MSTSYATRLLLRMLEYQNNLKLFHFQTKLFARHKASDELYEKLTTLIDDFFEVLQGKSQKLVPLKGTIHIATVKDKDILNYTKQFSAYLEHSMQKKCQLQKNSDLCNILDETRAALARFIYLLSFQ